MSESGAHEVSLSGVFSDADGEGAGAATVTVTADDDNGGTAQDRFTTRVKAAMRRGVVD